MLRFSRISETVTHSCNGAKRGYFTLFFYLFKKLKCVFAPFNSKNNGPVLLFKATILLSIDTVSYRLLQ